MHSRHSASGAGPADQLLQEDRVRKRMSSDTSVCFENVWFGHEEIGCDVLKGVDFEIPAGQMVALVGEAGAGKSSCARLLQRVWDVEAGAVRIGGADVRDLPAAVLRDMVAFVPQDGGLYHERTVLDNFRQARPGVTFAEIEAAARAAQVHEIIMRLPQAYETPYGAGCAQLTAGERQRIAIARVLAGTAAVVIWHETVSRLNAIDTLALQVAVSQLRRNRTVLLISHRLSSIRLADNIVVIEQGVVVEEGTHEHLVAWNDRYARLIGARSVRD